MSQIFTPRVLPQVARIEIPALYKPSLTISLLKPQATSRSSHHYRRLSYRCMRYPVHPAHVGKYFLDAFLTMALLLKLS